MSHALAILTALALCGCEPRPINDGATGCLIYGYVSPGMLADLNPGIPAEMHGLFIAGDPCRIYLDAPINPSHLWALHEYEHYIEWCLRDDPTAVRTVRHAFRGLMAPGFEHGRDDLMTEIP